MAGENNEYKERGSQAILYLFYYINSFLSEEKCIISFYIYIIGVLKEMKANVCINFICSLRIRVPRFSLGVGAFPPWVLFPAAIPVASGRR